MTEFNSFQLLNLQVRVSHHNMTFQILTFPLPCCLPWPDLHLHETVPRETLESTSIDFNIIQYLILVINQIPIPPGQDCSVSSYLQRSVSPLLTYHLVVVELTFVYDYQSQWTINHWHAVVWTSSVHAQTGFLREPWTSCTASGPG